DFHHFVHFLEPLFLGSTEVEQPKGTEVVRDAVRKLKFARHIKKSEGQKIPKVELQISIYGVKILEPKTKEVQHNCQLHRISFCADDKTDKRIFTFICKDSESNKHLCYVFDSEKCAEEITLTIGQAFDLAYRKFLESGGKDVETRKQIAGLQKRNLVFSCDFASLPDASHGDQSSRSSRCWIQDLEAENMELKNKVQDLESQLRVTQVSTSPAGSVTPKSPSTDIFDMIPFSPVSHPSSTPTRNGTQPPPIPSRSTEISKLSKQINILCYICIHLKYLIFYEINTLWKIIYLELTKSVDYQRIRFIWAKSANHILLYNSEYTTKDVTVAFETIL
uniref:PTB domain-containing engulfment adapter protein 1 n=1 Tax=Canis lupus familiaris TaxID=9615 RepID=A0A8C0S601_CANLF